MPKLPEAEPLETQAALAGADVELVAGDHPEEADGAVLDEQARDEVRRALPGWDVQPFQLSRAVDVAGGTGPLRTAVEQAGERHGRVPDIIETGSHLVMRVRTAGAAGVTQQDVELAVALDPVFSASSVDPD